MTMSFSFFLHECSADGTLSRWSLDICYISIDTGGEVGFFFHRGNGNIMRSDICARFEPWVHLPVDWAIFSPSDKCALRMTYPMKYVRIRRRARYPEPVPITLGA